MTHPSRPGRRSATAEDDEADLRAMLQEYLARNDVRVTADGAARTQRIALRVR